MAHVSFQKPVARVSLRRKYQVEREADWRRAQKEVWLRDEGKCRVCHVKVTKGGDSVKAGHIHHIIPRARLEKGRHAETSLLVLVCSACHADIHAYRVIVSGNANASFRVERMKEKADDAVDQSVESRRRARQPDRAAARADVLGE